MARKYSIYWYQKEQRIRDAFLYNCRDNDLQKIQPILKGCIIQGAIGFAVAECDVVGFTASIVPKFKSNRRCDWMGFTLSCMVHPQTPNGPLPKSRLRDFNSIVAELTKDAEKVAKGKGVPVVRHKDGLKLVNLEIATFERQGIHSPRRAKLL